MATSKHVTLQELLHVQDCAISEKGGWALLYQSTTTLLQSTKGTHSSWLVTPDTTLLYHSGLVKFCPGIPAFGSGDSEFIAPELHRSQQWADPERTYVYSLGMTLYHALEYSFIEGESTSISKELEAVLSGMISDAADERLSLHNIVKACKQYQDKHPAVSLSSEVTAMVESVLGGQLEFSFDQHNFPDMDDECLERELQQASNMKTSSERLSSCGASGSSQSLASRGSQQGLFSSTSSFRRPSVKSLGSGIAEWSAGLAPSLPPPSQRWSSYEGLHAPPQLNTAYFTTEAERRQLPTSPAQGNTSATPHFTDAKGAKRFSRPKSADISTYHVTLIPTPAQNADHPENASHDLPQLQPSAVNESPDLPQQYLSSENKSPDIPVSQPSIENRSHLSSETNSPDLPELRLPPVIPLEAPPSPVAMVRMSPKVAASLEKIDQVLAAAGGDSSDSTAITASPDSVITSSVKRPKIPPSPLLSGAARSPAVTAKQPDASLQVTNPAPTAVEEPSLPPSNGSPPPVVASDSPPPVPSGSPPPVPSGSPPPVPSGSPPPVPSGSPPPVPSDSPPPVPSSFPPEDEVDGGHTMDSSVEVHNTSDTLTDSSNTGMMATEGVNKRNETLNSEHETKTTNEEQVRQISNRKMVHSLKLSPLATSAATAEMTRTHSDYQIYKAGVLLKPLNKRFQSDDTLNMDTGIALASSTPIQSLLTKRISNSNISPVTNSNNSSTISSNISNHVTDEDPGYSAIAEACPPDDQVIKSTITIPVVESKAAIPDQSDEDPGYSIIAEVFPDKDQSSHLPNINHSHFANSDNIPVTDSKTLNHITNDNEDPGYSAIAEVFPIRDQPSHLPNITTNSTDSTDTKTSNHIPDDGEDPSYSAIADVFPTGVHKSTTPVVNTNSFDNNHVADEDPGYSSIAEVYPVSLHNDHLPTTTTEQETLPDPVNIYAKVNKPVQTKVTTVTPLVMHNSVEVVDVQPPPTVVDEPSSDNDPSLLYAKVNKSKQTGPVSARSTLQSKEGTKVTFADEADSNQLSHVAVKQDEVTLRHGNNLKVKSNSSQDLKDNVVDDPRRHSAMPASPQSYGVVEDQRGTGTNDEHKMSSSNKLQEVFGPDFATLSGGMWEKSVSFVAQHPYPQSIPSNRRVVNVILLNDKSFPVTVELSSLCQDVFDQVVSHLSLEEPYVFGLSIVKDEEDFFLDNSKRVSKYAPREWFEKSPTVRNPQKITPIFTVYFRIKFFVENIRELKTIQTCHYYFLQARRDIQHGRIYCHEETALLLASYVLQAEKGDYGPRFEGKEYYRLENYVPEKAISQLTSDYINRVLPHMHADHKGLYKDVAERQYLQEVQKLQEYGQVFYRLSKDKRKTDSVVVFGFCVRGIIVYEVTNKKEMKIPVRKLSWTQIVNIVYKQRRFELYINGNVKPLVYYAPSPKRARYLLGLAVSYHRYHMISHREALASVTSTDLGLEQPVAAATAAASTTQQQRVARSEEIKLLKEPGVGLGFKIMGGKKEEGHEGIFIKSIIKGSPADVDGKIKPFDQLLAINGQSLDGFSHKDVGGLVQQSSPVVQLTIVHHQTTDEEHELLEKSFNRRSPISEPEVPLPSPEVGKVEAARPQFTDERYRTVVVEKENNQLGFCVKGGVRGVYVSSLESGTTTARKRLLQVGSVIVAINGESVDGQSVHEVMQLLLNSPYQLELVVLPTSTNTTDDGDDEVDGDRFVVELDRGDDEDLGLVVAKRPSAMASSGLFFVKSLLPESPAAKCDNLMQNDIILQVNDVKLQNCSNEEVRRILYNAGQHVSLLVCRSVITMPVLSNSPSFVDYAGSSTPLHSSHTSVVDVPMYQEVEMIVKLKKGQKSFGFTINKHLSGQAGKGVFIEVVDDEPALSDGTLQAGDEIIKVNDTNLVNHPHQTGVYALRKVEPSEEAILVVRRQVEIEQFEVIFDKANEDTSLGLVVGERQLPFDQQQMCVTVLHVQPNSLASENGRLHVGDVIDKINSTQVAGSVDSAVSLLKDSTGLLTLHVLRCPTTDHQPVERPVTPTEAIDMASTPTTDDIPWSSENRNDTPPPPSSSPPPLSPVKILPDGSHDQIEETHDHTDSSHDHIDGSHDHTKGSHDGETWKEPHLDAVNYCNSEDSLRSSEFSDDIDAIFNEVDQSAYTSQLNASAAMGMHDSLGTLSNLSDKDITDKSHDLLDASHDSTCPPPLPSSPPPDL